MDLRYSEAEERFRADLRRWLAEVLPTLPPRPDPSNWPVRRAYDSAWQRMLYDAGYAGIDWPVDGGGRGASPVEQLIYLEELERAHAPYVGVNFVGLLHAGPTIVVEGSPDQRARFLPPILRGEQVWCQGFSEPGAGSDLAALRTRAVRDGDEYVVTGSKIWTSHAEVADMCELLVRTGPEGERHRGITWLAMEMDRPGIDFRPLRTIVGSTEFGELFMDQVRVPISNRVGEEGDGWRVAMVTLSFERGTAFVGEVIDSMELLRSLRALARRTGAWKDPQIRRRIGRLGAQLDALWALARRNVSEAASSGVPGVGGSVYKLGLSEARQTLAEIGMDVAGRAGLSHEPLEGLDGAGELSNADIVYTWLFSFSRTIAAGTSQIQRNIIAERILGMPKGA
jgi:alkylation response protein AidB-like acyl-CoA dehydrogenase